MGNTKRQLGVIGFLVAIVLAGFGVVVQGETAWARPPKVTNEPVLKVGVYNYADIGSLELREAEGEAGRLFARAGVRIVWADCALEEREISSYPQCSSRDIVLRLLPASMSDSFNPHAEALGAAISVPEPERAWVASVFNGRVASLASSWTLDPGLVLGEAAAHELGHLLLGPSHARDGVMRANWTQQDLEQASRGNLHFDAAEAAIAKETVRTMRAGPAPQAAVVLPEPGQVGSRPPTLP